MVCLHVTSNSDVLRGKVEAFGVSVKQQEAAARTQTRETEGLPPQLSGDGTARKVNAG